MKKKIIFNFTPKKYAGAFGMDRSWQAWIIFAHKKTYLCDGKLPLLAVVSQLKVVILPTRVVQYWRQPFGGLKYRGFMHFIIILINYWVSVKKLKWSRFNRIVWFIGLYFIFSSKYNFLKILYDTCCVFQPAFGCCAHPKSSWNTFFSCLQLFLSISVISRLKSTKKTFFCSFSHVFCWFQEWNHWKRFEMNKKVEKSWKKAGLSTQQIHKEGLKIAIK